ncbi:serpin-ZX [Coffea arabica]|uniref:Serpin-ZX n=1 Tax=Coffea arabica TaxID=13443 RepID=A0A6P6UUF4_COFAR|nr:serpin-ZX-like isoform X2 [Coffea arabica]
MDLRESISNQTHVSLSLAKHIISTKTQDCNFVFSPLSIQVLLALIASGSKGPTQDQLLSFLKSTSTHDLNSLSSQLVNGVFADGGPSGGPRISFANAVWVDQSLHFKPSFKEIVDDVYKAASDRVDFQNKPDEVTNEVNAWVRKETNGLIREILPSGSVDGTTRLILANALYFKGAWLKKFDESNTREHEFHLVNGSSIQVPFMTRKKKQYISAFDGFKVLRLPYKQGGDDKRRFSMYFFLPDAKDGLPAFVDKVSSEPGFLENHLPRSKVRVGVFRIPKFKISFGFEASQSLKQLGLVLPFSGEGLTEMVDSPVSRNLCVSSIFHKSFIEVNEEGTEAAAATAAKVVLMSYKHYDRLDFVADHPFLFLIREDMSGAVQFIGTLLNPLDS